MTTTDQGPGDFVSEKELVDTFLNHLDSHRSPWGSVRYSTEFNFQSGRTDVLIVTDSGELIAIEAKLDRWRYAAHQAYRNTTFANQSYVLVPEKTAKIAEKNQDVFEVRKVGLCSIHDNSITIIRPAERLEPIQICLHEKAISTTLS